MHETAERNATAAAVKSDMAPVATPRLMDRVRGVVSPLDRS